MKKSTVMTWAGFMLFIVGSMLVQLHIDLTLYCGIAMLGISFMLIDAKLNEIQHEGHMEELKKLKKNIDKSLDDMKKLVESDQTEKDETDYFEKKKSESNN